MIGKKPDEVLKESQDRLNRYTYGIGASKPVPKLFDDMTPVEKIDHIEKCLAEAMPEVLEVTCLADILDVWDYWAPYLIERLRKLEEFERK